MAKLFFFRQASSMLRQPVTLVTRETAAFCAEQCTT